MTSTDQLVDVFVDVGMTCATEGVLPRAAGELAAQLIAEGHGDALAAVTAAFWMANAARLAHADRWAAYETVRASLDKQGQEPPPPPPPPPDEDPPPQPQPDPEPGQ